jgi:hypothetical protein
MMPIMTQWRGDGNDHATISDVACQIKPNSIEMTTT